MTFVTDTWPAETCGPLSESNVRSLFAPADRYRVSRRVYDDVGNCREQTRAGQCVVLKGSVVFGSKTSQVTLRPGDVLHFPDGEYEIRVISEEVAELIYVWDVMLSFSPETAKQ